MNNIPREAATEQLHRILSSAYFQRCPALGHFLRFIVHETIHGRGRDLKEYTIAVSALKKSPDFDPQVDSIVRIHAGRLRRALKEYYEEHGLNDPVVITVPKGSYVPVFSLGSSSGHQNGATEGGWGDTAGLFSEKPAIAVIPFEGIGDTDDLLTLTRGFCEFLSTELTQFQELRVISHHAASVARSHDDIVPERGFNGTEYVLTGTMQVLEGHTRLFSQLIYCPTGDQLWGRTFEKPADAVSHLSFHADVVDKILAAIGGINGVVSRHQLTIGRRPGTLFSYPISYWYSRYVKSFDSTTIQEAKKYYQGAIAVNPGNALAHAYLSEIIAGEMALTGDLSNEGLSLAQRALKLDPFCQQAYQALAVNRLLHRQMEECIHILEQGLELNPRAADFRAAVGSIMIFAGNFDRGVKILEDVIKLNCPVVWWQVFSYSCYFYHIGRYDEAIYWADQAEVHVTSVLLVKIAAYSQMEQINQVNSLLSQVPEELVSSCFERRLLERYFCSDIFVSEVQEGLLKVRLALLETVEDNPRLEAAS